MENVVDNSLGLVWGAERISELLGLTPTQTFHLLASGKLPAKKVGGRWVAKHEALVRFFDEVAQ